MTAAQTRYIIDDHSPTTSFAGRLPIAPKPTDAADLVPLHARKSPSVGDPPVLNAAAAPVRRENAPSKAPPAARTIAKSP